MGWDEDEDCAPLPASPHSFLAGRGSGMDEDEDEDERRQRKMGTKADAVFEVAPSGGCWVVAEGFEEVNKKVWASLFRRL